MATIVSVDSFRGGTGKSNTTANLATTIALQGKRVGIIDTDIQSPGIHVIFNLDEKKINRSLNDYLWGNCAIADTAYHNVSPERSTGRGMPSVCHGTRPSSAVHVVPDTFCAPSLSVSGHGNSPSRRDAANSALHAVTFAALEHWKTP